MKYFKFLVLHGLFAYPSLKLFERISDFVFFKWCFGFALELFFSLIYSKALADYSKDFVVSVVLGKDLVPR